jgi:PAS domain S-box-containing protein
MILIQFLLRDQPWKTLLVASAAAIGIAFIATWAVQAQWYLYIDVMPIFLALTLDFFARMLASLKRQNFKLLMQSMALRRRDMFMRLVVDNNFDAVIAVNLEGHILSYNHAAKEIFGFEREEVMDQAMAKLLPKLRQKDMEISIETLLQLRSTHEILCDRRNGEDLILELSISQINTEDNLVIILLARDITAKRLAEAHAREAEDRLSKSLESLQESFALFDGHDKLLIANQKYREKGNLAALSNGGQSSYDEMIKLVTARGF